MRINRPRHGSTALRIARARALALLLALAGLSGAGRASPPVGPPPALPDATGAPGVESGGERDARRGPWRDLSPEQREAIRRLSQEQREALATRRWRQRTAPPFARLSPEERRQLREQIREYRERRGGRFGGGARP